jgi:hypothetical protein
LAEINHELIQKYCVYTLQYRWYRGRRGGERWELKNEGGGRGTGKGKAKSTEKGKKQKGNGEVKRWKGIRKEWNKEWNNELEKGDGEGKTVMVRRNVKQKG